jgi:hypothetical protein
MTERVAVVCCCSVRRATPDEENERNFFVYMYFNAGNPTCLTSAPVKQKTRHLLKCSVQHLDLNEQLSRSNGEVVIRGTFLAVRGLLLVGVRA